MTIRDRATGWIAWVIVILISVPFALWGVNEYFSTDPQVYVAQIAEEKISQRQLMNVYQQRMDRLRSQLGSNYRPGMFNEKQLKRLVLEEMIEQTLLLQAIQQQGFAISDKHLAQQIHATQSFLDEGKFSQARYERLLSSAGFTAVSYEMEERGQMVMSQLSNGIVASALPSVEEVEALVKLRDQLRKVAYLQLSAAAFSDEISISDAQVAERYEASKSLYMQPEKANLSYIELRVQDLESLIDVDEETLELTYQEQQVQFLSEEQRRASHILIMVNDEAADDAARTKIESLQARIRAGESFESVAKEASDDVASAASGGDLGLFGRNVMDQAFEEVAFSLTKGEVSEPVRSSFGYHLIKLAEIHAPEQKSFAEVREQLLETVKRERAEKLFYERAEELANLAYENPESLDPAAETLGLTVKNSGWMTRAGGGSLPEDPKVTDAAFSKEVLNERINSGVLEVTADHMVVLRLYEHKEPEQKPLDEVRGEIKSTLLAEATKARAEESAAEMLKQVAAGEALQNIAGQKGASLNESLWIKRDDKALPQSVVKGAFVLPHPDEGSSTQSVVSLPKGDSALVVVSGVKPGKLAGIDTAARQALQSQQLKRRGDQSLTAMVELMRKATEIRIFEENLE
ncbi:SurA N-terminal domain-containing protein [Candidatus Reidiella endopervernicosa]|nr:SurA N-terminal domain-containing protein [Candidatus Reidiella endopervernicosa]QKQ26354.1 SurA N-terminal domain-containing protein [Candidatus Reidiella endopervernicosa]